MLRDLSALPSTTAAAGVAGQLYANRCAPQWDRNNSPATMHRGTDMPSSGALRFPPADRDRLLGVPWGPRPSRLV